MKFDIYFLGLPWEIFFGVTTDHLLHLKPLKNVKKNAIFFKLFCYKIFVPWKLKLLNFLVDFILSWFWTSMLWSTDSCHNRVSTDQCHMTVLGAQVYNSLLSRMFFFSSFLLTSYGIQWIAGKENFTLEKTFLQSSHEIFVLNLYLYKINDPNQPGLASKFLTFYWLVILCEC